MDGAERLESLRPVRSRGPGAVAVPRPRPTLRAVRRGVDAGPGRHPPAADEGGRRVRLDLHIHTTASDGSRSPARVVEAALAGRLDVIAITDHDTTVGVGPATEAGRSAAIQIIPAIEVSSTHEGREIHVLGYFVDPEAKALLVHRARARERRKERILEMVTRLGEQGVEVDPEAVFRAAGTDRSSVGRPHLARALVDAGHADDAADAFDRLIGDAHPAFIPTDVTSPWEAAEMIRQSGGIPVWAHPPHDLVETLIPRFVHHGLSGLEVYRPRNRPELVLRLERLARAHGLLMSGGSDWHGPEGGTELGAFFVTADEVADLLAAGGL